MQGMPKPVADMGIEAMNAMRINAGNPEELIAEITRLCKSELHVYRGEHRVFDHVSSSIYRKYFDIFQAGGDFLPLNVEMEITQRARHSQYSFETPIEEILTDIRHFGGDTTLIDFSYSIPIALFFACLGKFEEDGRIIAVPVKSIQNMFDNQSYGEETVLSFLRPTRTENSRARTEFQSSVFVHAPMGYIDFNKHRFTSIIIPENLKRDCLDYLDRYQNIRMDTIYNDLIGFIENERNSRESLHWLYSGLNKYHNGEFEEAVLDFDRSIMLNPRNATAWYNRGRTKLFLGNHDEAALDFERAIELTKIS